MTGSGDCAADAARVPTQRAPAKKVEPGSTKYVQVNRLLLHHKRHISAVCLAIVTAKDKIIPNRMTFQSCAFPSHGVLICWMLGCFASSHRYVK